jgi:teichuronic acid exporter
MYGLLWLLAPLVAAFYRQDSLVNLMRFASLGMVVNSLGVVQTSVLMRSLDFRKLAIAGLTSVGAAGSVAIILALSGFGVWALAWQMIVAAFGNVVMLWIVSRWRPVMSFSLPAAKRMFGFGFPFLSTNIVTTIFDSFNGVLIGRFFSPADLGYYGRAITTQQVPVNTFSTGISRAMMPAMIHLKENPEAFRRAYRRAIQCTVAVCAPMMLGMMVLATPIFTIAYSDKWLPAVPYFQWLCAVGVLYPIHLLNGSLVLALGRSGVYFRLQVIRRGIEVAAALVALPHGVLALTQATLVSSAIFLVIHTTNSGRLAAYGFRAQICDIAPYLLNSVVAALLVFFVMQRISLPVFWECILGGFLFLFAWFPGQFLIRDNAYVYLLKHNPLRKALVA